MRSPILFLFALVLGSFFPHASQSDNHARLGIEALQRSYVERTGLYQTAGWWNAANAITVLVDYSRTTGSRQYLPVLANTFEHAQVVIPKAEQVGELEKMTGAPNFLNDYYDDEGWWALAWIDAYDLTGEARYLAMGRSIFADMAGGWDATCGGGIWWSKDRTYKNAIANELFFSVAAHLATRTEAAQYPDWARREWQWFQSSGMINSDGLVNDGLTINKADKADSSDKTDRTDSSDKASSTCRNNGKTVWTYNQGVLLGALGEWSKVSRTPATLESARHLATASITKLADAKGILHDPCEPKCGGDGIQFKGIFMRNLGALNTVAPDKHWKHFLQANANSIWKTDHAPDNQFGVVWSGPVTETNAGSQASALDALIAAAHSK